MPCDICGEFPRITDCPSFHNKAQVTWKTQCYKCLTAGINDPKLRSHLYLECPMPAVLHDAEADIRWCQNCYICGRYYMAEKCPMQWSMPR
eukprot:2513278-Alexandrium_andersonii.AAC.1